MFYLKNKQTLKKAHQNQQPFCCRFYYQTFHATLSLHQIPPSLLVQYGVQPEQSTSGRPKVDMRGEMLIEFFIKRVAYRIIQLLYAAVQSHCIPAHKNVVVSIIVCKKGFNELQKEEWYIIQYLSVDTVILLSITWNVVFPKALNWNETTQFLLSGPRVRLPFNTTL